MKNKNNTILLLGGINYVLLQIQKFCTGILKVYNQINKQICFIRILFLILGGISPIYSNAQVITDSLANDIRSFTARNISRYRTLNLYWETKGMHDYTLKMNGKNVEKGRKNDLHTIKFSTMFPILKQRNISLYANLQYNCYKFKNNLPNTNQSILFTQNAYNYYAGGLNGSYYINLFNKPLILSANITLDGWDKGLGQAQGRFSAVMVIVKKTNMSFSTGLMGMTLFNSIPIMPVITYWHRFNPYLSLDVTLPSQIYLRYQMRTQRISIGTSMSGESFYLKTNLRGFSETCYYSDAVFKPEIHYEYIINKHFYLSVHAGLSTVIKSGLYQKNRKEVNLVDENGRMKKGPIIEQERPLIPFFNFGISYSLFK